MGTKKTKELKKLVAKLANIDNKLSKRGGRYNKLLRKAHKAQERLDAFSEKRIEPLHARRAAVTLRMSVLDRTPQENAVAEETDGMFDNGRNSGPTPEGLPEAHVDSEASQAGADDGGDQRDK